MAKQAELEKKVKQPNEKSAQIKPDEKNKKPVVIDKEVLKRRVERVKKAFRSKWLIEQINQQIN